MTKWEYTILYMDMLTVEDMNEHGDLGWELCGVFGLIGYFKRPRKVHVAPCVPASLRSKETNEG